MLVAFIGLEASPVIVVVAVPKPLRRDFLHNISYLAVVILPLATHPLFVLLREQDQTLESEAHCLTLSFLLREAGPPLWFQRLPVSDVAAGRALGP